MAEIASIPVEVAPGRILVVDDDEAVLELLEEFLSRAGHESQRATGGREAIEAFRKDIDEIGLVVLDMTMPDVDGREVFEAIRSLRADVPVVLATGHGLDRLADTFSGEHRVSLLQKPYEPEQLFEAISAASRTQGT